MNKIIVKDIDDLRREFIKKYYGDKKWRKNYMKQGYTFMSRENIFKNVSKNLYSYKGTFGDLTYLELIKN